MKPPKRDAKTFEKVPAYDTWINGKIIDIEYDEAHRSTYQGEEKVRPAVRFKLGLEGCNFPKRTRWMTFSYNEKAGLFKQFVSVLVEGAKPDMDLDLDVLKGMAIKTMWSQNEEFDNLAMIRPLGEKVKADAAVEVTEVPF